MDALHQYHEAARRDVKEQEYQHTILILDKTLHAFPWESLNCLKNRSVSRLPSLQCLRDRILQQQEPLSKGTEEIGHTRYTVNKSNGAYIMNPSGDLKTTQSQFEEPLRGLGGWDSIVNRIPTEDEMKNLLQTKEVFLYFGHGSGCQYIRPRAIKCLDKCAVSLLMGCSSGALTEAGVFEPYGTPVNYMNAGSAALLATLWDVTDKDIDRFSMKVFQDWGLFEESGSNTLCADANASPTKRSRRKGKEKVVESRHTAGDPKRAVSLCEAVANARDSCILQYLNGAAPVVYGIPVFIKD